MAQSSYQGRFVWHELLCNDTTAATVFYTRVLSWTAQPFSPGSPYMMFMAAGGKAVAGAMALADDARAMGTVPHWRGYIGAADVDAVVAQASRLGARILQPAQDLPAVGRVAMLADPEGARFGVYRPLTESAGDAAGNPGFAWCELAARSRENALAFYQQLFGWELRTPMDMGGGFHYQTFGLGGEDFGGAYTIPADRPMPPAWCPYASSSSADETAGKVVAAGGQLCHGPIDVPGGGRIVQFFDPQHAMFAVHSMAVAAASRQQACRRKPPQEPQEAARKPVKKARRQAARKSVRKKAAKRPVAKRARKGARKVVRKGVRKVARKAQRKSARKPARRPARKKVALEQSH